MNTSKDTLCIVQAGEESCLAITPSGRGQSLIARDHASALGEVICPEKLAADRAGERRLVSSMGA